MYRKAILNYIFCLSGIIKRGALLIIFALIIQLISPVFVGTAKADGTLFAVFYANPSSGPAPLNNVDLTATVSGTATGDITYRFDCTNDGSWEYTVTSSATTYTVTDLCDYSLPGSYSAKVRVERENLSVEGKTAIFVLEGATLFAVFYATPAVGQAPLYDVDITAEVSGTATSDITYRFDCTSDGSWEKTYTTGSTSYTAYDLCDYPSAGNYTAIVKVERDNLSATGRVAIYVEDPATLFVDLTADPSFGDAPLNNVDLTADVSGTAIGNITYWFDCRNDGSWERTITTSSDPYTVYDLCDYSFPGTYTAKVRVEREGLSAEDTTEIFIEEISTLHLSITATPSSGHAPLNNVDLAADVLGTATGNITYRFDCRNDGSWERTHTTSNTSYTAYDLCDYSSTGIYTVKVRAEREGLVVQGTINVVVGDVANLAVDFSVNPSSGDAPLNNVDLTVYISGTATGDITYRFDCRNDGSWERTHTTSSNSYTAYDLCDYSSAGVYTTKVKVERGGVKVEGTATIVVSSS